MRKQLFLFLFLSSFFAEAQQFMASDSITLLNGHTYWGAETRVEGNLLVTNVLEKNGEYEMMFDLSRVFSVSSKEGETVYYKQDELQGDYLTVQESRETTWGSRDARITSKPWGVTLTSITLGFGFSLWDTYLTQKSIDELTVPGNPPPDLEQGFFGSNPSMMQLIVPATYSLVWAFPSFKVREHQILQENMKGNAFYYRGYNRIARQKRMFAALYGGFIGTGLGLITYGIFKKN